MYNILIFHIILLINHVIQLLLTENIIIYTIAVKLKSNEEI